MLHPGSAAGEDFCALLEDAFHAVWRGAAESDGFNKLVSAARLPLARCRGVAQRGKISAPGRIDFQPGAMWKPR